MPHYSAGFPTNLSTLRVKSPSSRRNLSHFRCDTEADSVLGIDRSRLTSALYYRIALASSPAASRWRKLMLRVDHHLGDMGEILFRGSTHSDICDHTPVTLRSLIGLGCSTSSTSPFRGGQNAPVQCPRRKPCNRRRLLHYE